MAARKIPSVAASCNERAALASRERLHDDPRGVPASRTGVTSDCEEDSVTARQHLRPVRHLVRFHRRYALGRPSGGWHTEDASIALAEQDPALSPRYTGGACNSLRD